MLAGMQVNESDPLASEVLKPLSLRERKGQHWEPPFLSSEPFLFPSPRPGIALHF